MAWTLITIGNDNKCVISGDVNGCVDISLLTTVTPVYTYLATLADPGITISLADTNILVIINDVSVGFSPNDFTTGNDAQTFEYATLIPTSFDNLAADIIANL